MTTVIRVRNVNEAVTEGLWHLRIYGVREDSRNGPVLVSPGPVITEYSKPKERILFLPERDANPVFHLMEAIWMLAGRDDVAWLTPFNSRMSEYAEDNGHLHGAYGYRWMHHFGFNQFESIREELSIPGSRRAVMAMWDPYGDLRADKKDLPCNTHIYFDVRNGSLNMTVCCRSNDMLWGAYGANVVHFSILQEVLAASLEVEVGVYRQMSNNFHIYPEVPMAAELLRNTPTFADDPYARHDAVAHLPIIPLVTGDYRDFMHDCTAFCAGLPTNTPFFGQIVKPLSQAYLLRSLSPDLANSILAGVPDCDWKLATQAWFSRRAK